LADGYESARGADNGQSLTVEVPWWKSRFLRSVHGEAIGRDINIYIYTSNSIGKMRGSSPLPGNGEDGIVNKSMKMLDILNDSKLIVFFPDVIPCSYHLIPGDFRVS